MERGLNVDISKLLCAKTVAVVGASEKRGFGRKAVENLMSGSLGENLFLVNPGRDQVLGRKCYKSLADIGKPIDLAVFCTPMVTVNGLLREAGELGIKAAVVYASGYGEAGQAGKDAQNELKEIARQYDMAICGPNCGGFINNEMGLYPFGLDMAGKGMGGNIGLISQSGQICSMLASIPYLNFSYLISSGNCAVAGVEDYMEFLVDNEATKVVAIYLEGVTKPQKFTEILAKAARKHKPVVALKVGTSKKAQQTTTAHTGSLAGDDAAFKALFKKYGVIRVNDMEDLIETCMIFSVLDKKVPVDGIGIMSLSGGEAAISADACSAHNVELGDLAQETKDKIKPMLPDFASINNPLDMTSSLVRALDCYKASVQSMIEDPSIGLLAMGHNPPELVPEDERVVDFGFAKCLAEVNETSEKPIVILAGFSRKRDPELRAYYAEHHIAMLDNPKYGLSAVRRYIDHSMYNCENRTHEAAVPTKKAEGRCVLTEHESKEILKQYDIPIPPELTASDAEGVKAAVKELGFPLVMKIDSPDVPHKTDAGGVKLNIRSEDEALAAFDEILRNVRSYAPDARLNGVLIQQMLPKGTELILGVNMDPQFGPMVLVGLGGIFTELFKDAALYPAPLNYDEALEMIRSLKAYPLLTGYRGSKPLDIDAVANMIVKLGDLAVDKKDEIKELDINPVFVYEKGAYAADALIVTGKD